MALTSFAALEPAAAASPPVADAVSLDDGAERAVLRFDLSAPVDASAFVLAKPDRVVVDLPETDFRINPDAGEGASPDHHRAIVHGQPAAAFHGLIASYRFGLFAPGKSRIVIDLSGPARILRATSDSEGGKPHLVISLAKTDNAAFQAAAHQALAAAQAGPKAPEPAIAASPPPGLPVVVVDPGHGGVDTGAMVDGIIEKNIVFGFALELADKLKATGRYKVIMTRDRDVFIPLGERVHIARDSNAALFVSVHADTLTADAQTVAGATVYTNSDKATDAEAARTAEKENQADAVAGVEGKEEASGVSDILFDLTRRETRAYSHVFARTLVNYWKVAGRLNKNPERAAGFKVLTAPDVPSVLLELGYLSNVKDAKSLTTPAWRDATTDKVVAAINAFFDSRGKAGLPAEAVAATPDPATVAAAPLNTAAAAGGLAK